MNTYFNTSEDSKVAVYTGEVPLGVNHGELLDKFQGLRQLIDTDHDEFCMSKGLGPVKYVQIQAAIELGRRYLESGLKNGDAFTSPDQTLQNKTRLNEYISSNAIQQ